MNNGHSCGHIELEYQQRNRSFAKSVPKQEFEAVSQLQRVHDPPELAVPSATLMVVAHEQLIYEQRGQQLRAVVVEPPMPNSMVQLEQGFEPLVKRFDGLFPPRVETPTSCR